MQWLLKVWVVYAATVVALSSCSKIGEILSPGSLTAGKAQPLILAHEGPCLRGRNNLVFQCPQYLPAAKKCLIPQNTAARSAACVQAMADQGVVKNVGPDEGFVSFTTTAWLTPDPKQMVVSGRRGADKVYYNANLAGCMEAGVSINVGDMRVEGNQALVQYTVVPSIRPELAQILKVCGAIFREDERRVDKLEKWESGWKVVLTDRNDPRWQ